MSSLNKVGSFVHSRTRNNWFGAQHPPPSSEQPLRRPGPAGGNTRAVTSVTGLPTTPRHRPNQIEKTTPYNEPNDINNEENRNHELHQPLDARDAFDTEAEDLTESLLSEEVPAEHNRQNIPPRDHDTSGHTRPSQRRQGGNTTKPPDSQHGQNINRRGFDDTHVLDDDDASDSDEDAQPADDPTVTFTPEQIAQVQDPARRQLQLERTQDITPSKPGVGNSKSKSKTTAPYQDLYDVTGGPSSLVLPRDEGRQPGQQRLPRNNSAPGPAQRSSTAGISEPVNPRPHTTAPLATNRSRNDHEDGLSLFEPSDVMEETEDDNDDHIHHQAKGVEQPQSSNSQSKEVYSDPVPKPINTTTSRPSHQQSSPQDESESELPQKEEEKKYVEKELDYPPSTLLSMSYNLLSSESQDYIPPNSTSTSPTSPTSTTSKEPLPTRLQSTISLPPSTQKQFFNSLSLRDWEESGDWFIEQFSIMMNRMKEARRKKRDVEKSFEEEVGKRSENVEHMRGGYEEVLKDMRRGGMGLLGRE
ncbi:MAG: hypothetical protein M1823_000020 [Watsoniomyces obsoletus]|nr:MAG: hypothetical protein M1823_000020 [Watsoniomyces obsoletus]